MSGEGTINNEGTTNDQGTNKQYTKQQTKGEMNEVTVMKGYNEQQIPKRGTQQQGRHYCSGDSAEEGCGSGGAGGKETVTFS